MKIWNLFAALREPLRQYFADENFYESKDKVDWVYKAAKNLITLTMCADTVGMARGFMMSGGCIRARICSGFGSYVCPVGFATQNEKKRASYLVIEQRKKIGNYHNNLVKSMKVVLAVMGLKSINDLDKSRLTFTNRNGEIFFDIDLYFHQKLHI